MNEPTSQQGERTLRQNFKPARVVAVHRFIVARAVQPFFSFLYTSLSLAPLVGRPFSSSEILNAWTHGFSIGMPLSSNSKS